MAKYFGKIGYAITSETSPGVWTDTIVERDQYGELSRVSRRLSQGESINDDINISNQLSILADPFAMNNFQTMRYATYLNSKWKVTDVEVDFPRLTLTLGGIYNEN